MRAEPIRVEIDVEWFGKALAHASDWEQGAVISALASELNVSCGGRHRNVETQICYISDKLTESGEKFILDLAEFIKLRHKETP